MASHEDVRAAMLLLALLLTGTAVRAVLGRGTPPGAVGYQPATDARPAMDSLSARAERLARPLRPGETVDVDRATAEELTRLPRVGPALARRIVADRDARGGFGSLAELDRVPGIGPVLLEGVRRHVTFSGRPGPRSGSGRASRVRLNTATAADLAGLPGIGPARAAAIVESRRQDGPFRRIDDLRRIPGIGPKTVARLRNLVQLP